MAVGGQYTVQLRAILDTKGVLAQIAAIQKQAGGVVIGGAKGKGGAFFTDAGKGAQNAQKKVKSYSTALGKASKQNKAFGSTTLDVTKKVVQFGAVTAVIRGVTSGMGDMVRQTFELDSALTEFKKVSDLSGKGLEKYTEQAYKAGRETAKTGVEMIDAATQFKKMGYDEQTSLQLATHATMFQNIADAEISAGDAAKFINSQMKAYKDEFSSFSTEGEKAAKVIDTVNEVANKNAVGTNDLQLALTKTSAAMSGFGNSFDETVGIMTAGTEIMVGMPSQVARGWRTIAANILQVAQSTDEYTAASGKVKIATRDQNGEMKNTYSMMKDLYTGIDGVSASWKDLSKEEQSAIALELAGKNNMEKFRAVMDNFGTAIKATEEAQNSQGSATKENARYLDSMEGSLQNLRSAWSEFSNAMVKGDTIKGLLNNLASVVRFLSGDFGQALIKGAAGLLAFGGAFKLFKGLGSLVLSPLSSISRVFGLFGKNTNKSIKPLGKFSKNLKATKAPLINGAKNATKASKGFRAVGSAASGASMAINPLALGLAAATAVFVGAAVGAYKTYKATHKYRREVSDLVVENKKAVKSIDDNAKSAELLTDTIDRLNGVENKSASQKELLKQAVQELNEMYPELNLSYDEEADKVNKSTDAIRKHIDAKKEEAKLQAYTDGMKKAVKEQLSLQEKRAKAQEKFAELDKQYQEAQKSGWVSPQLSQSWNNARIALKDVSQAYSQATIEATKQNNNMLKASGVWKDLAGEAKKAGIDISDGVKKGIDEGIYTIPKTVQGLENLNMFDDLADKLDVTKAGQSLVNALQQGMREGDLKPSEALKIAEGFQELQGDLSTEGKKAAQELSDAFANGEIDFSTFKQGMAELSELEAKPKVEVEGAEQAQHELINVTKDLNSVEREKVLAEIGVEGAVDTQEEVEAVQKYLKNFDEKEYKFGIKADTKKADKALKKTTKQTKAINKSKPTIKVGANTKGADKNLDRTEKKAKDYGKTTSTAKLNADTSNADSGVDSATSKVQMFDGVEAIAFLQQHGAEVVEAKVDEAGNAVLSMPDGKTVIIEQDGSAEGQAAVENLVGAINNLKGKSVKATATTSGEGAVRSLQNAINGLRDKSVTLTANYRQTGRKPGIQENAKGTRNAAGGLSEVNEEGWEFIRDAKTGKLRIAGGGKRTVTVLNKGDIVYTHAQSKQMVSSGETDIHIPQRKSGQNNNKKQQAQEAYDKQYDRLKDRYEAAVGTLEYRAKMRHWTDEVLAKRVQATYNGYIKQLKKMNNSKAVSGWKKSGAKVKTSFGVEAYRDVYLRKSEALHDKTIAKWDADLDKLKETGFSAKVLKTKRKQLANLRKQGRITSDEYTDYLKELNDAYSEAQHDKLVGDLDKSIESLGLNASSSYLSKKTADAKIKSIASLYKKGRLTVDEYKEYVKEINTAYIDGQMKLHQANKKSYKAMKDELSAYAKAGKITWAEYYEYIETLMEEQLDKQKKALSKQQEKVNNVYSLATSWLDREIERLEKANEETSEQNDLIEKQSNLEKTRTQRVKVYRQGQGFIYEQDTQAIKEATNALQTYKKEQDSPELKALKEVRELFNDLELDAEIKNYETLIGSTFSSLFGDFGTDIERWTTFIKDTLAHRYGYENLANTLDDIDSWRDIQSYLDADGNIKSSIIDDFIAKNRFTTGTLSAPASFARVAENGYGTALLGQGDAVIPHKVSENLMAWGAHSPVEFATFTNDMGQSQIYNFDKLVLPNVTDVDSFINELSKLPNKALQYSRGRA